MNEWINNIIHVSCILDVMSLTQLTISIKSLCDESSWKTSNIGPIQPEVGKIVNLIKLDARITNDKRTFKTVKLPTHFAIRQLYSYLFNQVSLCYKALSSTIRSTFKLTKSTIHCFSVSTDFLDFADLDDLRSGHSQTLCKFALSPHGLVKVTSTFGIL